VCHEGGLERYVGSIGERRRKSVGLWCSAWWTGGVYPCYGVNLFLGGPRARSIHKVLEYPATANGTVYSRVRGSNTLTRCCARTHTS